MLTATITVAGQTIVLKGEPDQIIAAIGSMSTGALPVRRGPGRPPGSGKRGPGRPPKIAAPAGAVQMVKARKPVSAERREQQKLQGQYLGALKALSLSDKKKVREITSEKGVSAGLAEAKRLRAAKD